MTLPELTRNFEKRMDAFHAGRREVYRSFLRLCVDSFLSDHTPEHPRELDFMDTMNKYSYYDKAYSAFGDMLGDVMAYTGEHNLECLSELWEVFSSNPAAGQFFTPWSVCELMAQMAMPDIDWSKFSPENKCGISDPACGGGRTLIAALKQKVPMNKLNSVYFHGIDVDEGCCFAAALNMLFFNANSFIVHGNALTLQVWHVYRTIHTPLGGHMVEITGQADMERIIEAGLRTRTPESDPMLRPAPPAEKHQKQNLPPAVPLVMEQGIFNF